MDTVQDASGQPFAGWLEGELARYYEPAAVLRRSDRKEILLYRHAERSYSSARDSMPCTRDISYTGTLNRKM